MKIQISSSFWPLPFGRLCFQLPKKLHGNLGVFCLCTFFSGCQDTSQFSTKELESIQNAARLDISDEEAEKIYDDLVLRQEAGEDFSPSVRAFIQIATTHLAFRNPWKGLSVKEDSLIQIQKKYQVYLGLAPQTALDSAGFVPGCDGLLFTSLFVSSGGKVNLNQAESPYTPGRWHRSASKDCFASRQSASTISRDMVLGLALALWQTQDLAAVLRFNRYAKMHNGVIGDAESPATLRERATMSPSLTAMFHELQFRLGGPASPLQGYIPDYSHNVRGFAVHLQAIGILLRGALFGGLTKKDLATIRHQSDRQAKNALLLGIWHGFSDGSGQAIADILLNQQLFPESRLPTTLDRCGSYLWEHEPTSQDWRPCQSQPDNPKSHPGVDFLLPASLILGKLRISKL